MPGSACAADISIALAGVGYLTAGAETAQALCPPHPKNFKLRADSENIVGQLSRRLQPVRGPIVEARIDDVKAAIVKRLPA